MDRNKEQKEEGIQNEGKTKERSIEREIENMKDWKKD